MNHLSTWYVMFMT